MGKFSGTDGVGLPWYRREDYPRILTVMADNYDLPRSFDEWEKRAHEAVKFVVREGGKPVRVEVKPDKFITYCSLRGLNVDAHGRQMFAADPANWPASNKH